MIDSSKQRAVKYWKDVIMKIKANVLEKSKGPDMIRKLQNTIRKDATRLFTMQKLDNIMLYTFLFWGSWPNLS